MKCVFCKIVKKEIPAAIVLEDDEIMAFKDVRPLAPVHILIIPKKHIESVNDFRKDDVQMIGRMIIAAKMLASDLDISEKGYKLLFRVGEWGGQEVPHVHLHLIGGAPLHENIHAAT
ncbi:MAG TPA: histidine triad nucleotide-binding protein [Candidatus Moranbacteria bacterium]|nr:histidine triad nucleotide-binding protein [Candidatus Moranbacteria bacterium]